MEPTNETQPISARRLWRREQWRRQKRIQRARAKGITPFRPTRHPWLRVVELQVEASRSEGALRKPPQGVLCGPPSLT
jgi:hypothetical protein